MHNLMPPNTKIAALINPANIPQSAAERSIIQNAAHVLGARILILNASSPSEIEVSLRDPCQRTDRRTCGKR